MRDTELTAIDGGINEVAQHACHALLALGDLRYSPDPAMRLAYRQVHDLIGDLGALRITVSCMPVNQDGSGSGPDRLTG
ncbi:hypothetical protein [Nocardioides lianchengensis]|uniref:Histidine kinase n=1 Tax=Nocardioides lianchengensis TaxID=1045774 RepID=A0A1G6YYS4_9ACTN|nr:hypothetical protein [Nocardioides lianchengensis]NYG09505.1 hypothetical protein [Nocardioides lianchengensis]SDD94716.1 hypothetical protein SAMN05421872_112188 [Nocardioides lianchengensis]